MKSQRDIYCQYHLYKLSYELEDDPFWKNLRYEGIEWCQRQSKAGEALASPPSPEFEAFDLPSCFVGLLLSWNKPVYLQVSDLRWVRSEDLDLLEAFLEGLGL